LYDVIISDIKPCSQANDQQLFRGGEFTITAKELYKIEAFGPDNISTDAWEFSS
jgi:hypothetical protein